MLCFSVLACLFIASWKCQTHVHVHRYKGVAIIVLYVDTESQTMLKNALHSSTLHNVARIVNMLTMVPVWCFHAVPILVHYASWCFMESVQNSYTIVCTSHQVKEKTPP